MKRRDILLLLGSSVFLIVIWGIFSVIHRLASSTINGTVSQAISPISPDFDLTVINALKTRVKIAPDFSSSVATTAALPTPTNPPQPTPQQIASPSAVPSLSLFAPTPTGTAGGTLQ